MPRVDQLQAVQFTGFEQGLNKATDSSRLEPEELSTALNVRLGPRGEVRLRSGYSRYDLNLDDQIDWLYPWRSITSTDFIVAVQNDGSIMHDSLDGSFWDQGFSVGDQSTLSVFGVGIAGAKERIYVGAKGIADVRSFNGTSWSSVPGIPKGKLMFFRHNRLFVLNTTDEPSVIHFSNQGTPEIFVDKIVDMDPEDGYEINAADTFNDDLVMFKDHAVWKLAGRTPASFALYKIDSHRGCVSPRGTAQLRGLLVFYDRDTGVWAFNGASFELLSEPINDYILEGADYAQGYRASMYASEDRLYLCVPWAAGGFRTFIYFADTGGWSEYTTGFEGSTIYLDERYLGLPGADGIYTADPASRLVPPSSTPLVASFRTGWYLVAGPGTRARIRRIEMTVKGPDTTDFTVRLFRDFNRTTPYQTRTFTAGEVPYAGPIALLAEERRIASNGWGNRLHAFQLEFETNDLPFQLNDVTVYYTSGEDVRGVK